MQWILSFKLHLKSEVFDLAHTTLWWVDHINLCDSYWENLRHFVVFWPLSLLCNVPWWNCFVCVLAKTEKWISFTGIWTHMCKCVGVLFLANLLALLFITIKCSTYFFFPLLFTSSPLILTSITPVSTSTLLCGFHFLSNCVSPRAVHRDWRFIFFRKTTTK